MCIDYGRRRCGIAATDTLRIVATGITTVATAELIKFLKDYTSREPVDAIVIGRPVTLQGEPSESMRYITPAVARMRKEFPGMKFIFWDERFTSAIAHRAMIDGGMKKHACKAGQTIPEYRHDNKKTLTLYETSRISVWPSGTPRRVCRCDARLSGTKETHQRHVRDHVCLGRHRPRSTTDRTQRPHSGNRRRSAERHPPRMRGTETGTHQS